MAFQSTGNSHHDLGLVEAGAADRPDGTRALHHVALKLGDTLTELTAVRQQLDVHNVAVHMVLDHRVSQGIYVSDPDGNLLELHVDGDPPSGAAIPRSWPTPTRSS
jgi:catechol 2,3-dioxygenase